MDIFYKHDRHDNMNPNYFALHTHSQYEIFMISSGQGTFVVEGHFYPLPKNSIILLRPGEMHRAEIAGNCIYERYYLQFDSEVLNTLDPSGRLSEPFDNRTLGMDNYYAPESIDNAFIKSILKKSGELLSDYPGEFERIKHYLYVILEELFKGFKAKKYAVTLPHIKDNKVYEIIEYINENILNPLTVVDIEKKFFMSRPVLTKRFKHITGTTVWNYIITKRVVLAKQMMQNGESATNAAYAAGFGDYSSFYRAYLKNFGITPRTRD